MNLKPEGFFSEQQLELDIINILQKYHSNGFIEAEIISAEKKYNSDSTNIDIIIKISEGNRTAIGEINLSGYKLFSSRYIRSKMQSSEGDVLDENKLNQDILEILNLYESRGYTFTSVIIEDIGLYENAGKKLFRINIKINENDFIKIDKIAIEGNTSTNKNVIERELRLSEGNKISKDKLIDYKQRLENTGYFEQVENPKIVKYKNYTVLLIKLKEGNTNTFDGILGYVPPAENEDRGYITGFANISLRNLFGTGRKAEARFKKENRNSQELELGYTEPWILGYPVNGSLGFLQRAEDSSYIKRDFSSKFEAIITNKLTLSALFYFQRVIPTAENSLYTIFNSRVIGTGAEVKYDSRDYIFNPFRGILYKTIYTAGQKKIYNASNFSANEIQPDFTVQRVRLDLEIYHSFFKSQSLLISLHGVEIKSPAYEQADLFSLGGIYTVRGYREGQFLSSRASWGNIELRYSLSRKSFASVFYDLGYYKKPEDKIFNIDSQEGFIYGYGLGIRIETPLGMFGVSYALGRGDSILEGKVHFGIINEF
jgi:outer membrane protein insertion porin family